MTLRPDPEMGKQIGHRIMRARKEAGGMTQRELGELIGVTERSIAAYESGEVIPYRFMSKIAAATGISSAYILHGEKADRSADLQTVIEKLDQILARLA